MYATSFSAALHKILPLGSDGTAQTAPIRPHVESIPRPVRCPRPTESKLTTNDEGCPLRHLNINGLFVEPVTGVGIVLTTEYSVSESLSAHIILWTLARWDTLLPLLWWDGPELPRRVEVRSLNKYPLPTEE